MTAAETFAFPRSEDPLTEWNTAVVRLNALPVTADQLDRAVAAYTQPPEPLPNVTLLSTPDDMLRAFCKREGLLPVDVAMAMLMVRKVILEAGLEGIDFKEVNPEDFVLCATRSIDLEDLGYWADEADGDREMLATL